jgi:hypothetical protein
MNKRGNNDNDFYLGVPLRVGQGFARNLRKTIVIVYARLYSKSSRDTLKFLH